MVMGNIRINTYASWYHGIQSNLTQNRSHFIFMYCVAMDQATSFIDQSYRMLFSRYVAM